MSAWSAAYVPGDTFRLDQSDLSTYASGGDWMPLRQAWRTGGPEEGFRPAWARIRWTEKGLLCETIFSGGGARNAARTLNERTWELGDVAELFVLEPGGARYLEVHVTPENVRLQLRFPVGAIARVRAGEETLESYLVDDPGWVSSRSVVGPSAWSTAIFVPAAAFNLVQLESRIAFRAAVCRYDCASESAVLSSTAPLTQRSFHAPHEWQHLHLASPSVPEAP